MNVDLKNKRIELRSSEMSGWGARCMRSFVLQSKMEKPTEPTPNQKLGTNVHSWIQKKLDPNFDEELPPEMPTDVAHLLRNPNIIYKNIGFEPGTTLEENLSPNMFGPTLTRFERRYQFEFNFKGWTFSIGGTTDASNESGTLIVDWKTTKTTPPDKTSYRFVNYYIQQAIYRALYLRENSKPLETTKVIIGYIVKTKRPKFMPQAYNIKKSLVIEADKLIRECATAIVDSIIKEKIPLYSFGDCCFYCPVEDQCRNMNNLLPQMVDMRTILIADDNE